MSGVILLSAGLDSTVALAEFLHSGEQAVALTFNYGQRAAKQEIARAEQLAVYYGIQHVKIDLPFLAAVTHTALVNPAEDVPLVSSDELDQILSVTLGTAEKVWVPNRNGLFINIAAAYAESLGYGYVVAGFNAEEAVTFPDNSPQFVAATNQALGLSTLNQVQVISPTQNLNKMEIVEHGAKLQIPWHLIWSCYHGATTMCGECESCQRLKRALSAQGYLTQLDRLFPANET